MGKNIREKVKCKLTMATSSLQFPTTRSSGLGRILMVRPWARTSQPFKWVSRLSASSSPSHVPFDLGTWRCIIMYIDKNHTKRESQGSFYVEGIVSLPWWQLISASHTCIYTYIHTQTLKRQREIYTHELIIKRGAKVNDF